MKKLKFNSTLNHKQSNYKTREVIVEKVITLYDRSFSELKDHPLRDDPYIAENRESSNYVWKGYVQFVQFN